jgi:hypothetical protein
VAARPAMLLLWLSMALCVAARAPHRHPDGERGRLLPARHPARAGAAAEPRRLPPGSRSPTACRTWEVLPAASPAARRTPSPPRALPCVIRGVCRAPRAHHPVGPPAGGGGGKQGTPRGAAQCKPRACHTAWGRQQQTRRYQGKLGHPQQLSHTSDNAAAYNRVPRAWATPQNSPSAFIAPSSPLRLTSPTFVPSAPPAHSKMASKSLVSAHEAGSRGVRGARRACRDGMRRALAFARASHRLERRQAG